MPSATGPPGGIPVVAPASAKDDAMETDPPFQTREQPPTAMSEENVASSSSVASNALSSRIQLISQYTCLSITAPTLQDHLRTIEHYYVATLNPKRPSAHEALKHDCRLAETKLAALNTTRSNLVKELVKSDTSQVLAERRQRLEEGVTALRVAELLKKVEGIRKRIDESLQEKQEMTPKRSALIQHRPTSPHKPNSGSSEIIDVDAIMTDHSETASPTQPRTIKNMIRQVEALANEVETVAEFLDIGGAKVGEAVENLIPAWEAVTKEDNEEEERKDVERMMTELAEAMQAVRDGVETVQSICMYEEQTDADEEAEMVKLRKEMTLLQRERKTQQADLQIVRSEIKNAQWELPASVGRDEFISDIRARVEYLIQPLFDQLEAAETKEKRLLKEACNQELEAKRIAEEMELNAAVADGRRRTNELIADALSTVAMVKKDVKESKRRQEAKQASQWSAGAYGQPHVYRP